MMAMIKVLTLLVRFLLELGILAAVGYWGFTTGTGWLGKVVFGLGTPLLIAVLWGMFGAPKAVYPLPGGWLLVFELIVFAAAPTALFATHRPGLAWLFVLIYLINKALMVLWQQ